MTLFELDDQFKTRKFNSFFVGWDVEPLQLIPLKDKPNWFVFVTTKLVYLFDETLSTENFAPFLESKVYVEGKGIFPSQDVTSLISTFSMGNDLIFGTSAGHILRVNLQPLSFIYIGCTKRIAHLASIDESLLIVFGERCDGEIVDI